MGMGDTSAATTGKAGLEDVVACESQVCFIDGKQGRLVYRGYDVADLAAHATFEESPTCSGMAGCRGASSSTPSWTASSARRSCRWRR